MSDDPFRQYDEFLLAVARIVAWMGAILVAAFCAGMIIADLAR